MCFCPFEVGYRVGGCGGGSFVFFCWVFFANSLVLVCMVEVVGVIFPIARVCLGSYCLCYVLGDRLDLGSLVVSHA